MAFVECTGEWVCTNPLEAQVHKLPLPRLGVSAKFNEGAIAAKAMNNPSAANPRVRSRLLSVKHKISKGARQERKDHSDASIKLGKPESAAGGHSKVHSVEAELVQTKHECRQYKIEIDRLKNVLEKCKQLEKQAECDEATIAHLKERLKTKTEEYDIYMESHSDQRQEIEKKYEDARRLVDVQQQMLNRQDKDIAKLQLELKEFKQLHWSKLQDEASQKSNSSEQDGRVKRSLKLYRFGKAHSSPSQLLNSVV